ncbi:unnamed protein product, partial [marine sediment metagenome]
KDPNYIFANLKAFFELLEKEIKMKDNKNLNLDPKQLNLNTTIIIELN